MLSWHHSPDVRVIIAGLGWEKGGAGMILGREQGGRRKGGRPGSRGVCINTYCINTIFIIYIYFFWDLPV